MSKKIRSARGEMVDFSLLEMKYKMAQVKPSEEVSARKAKIEARPVYVETPTVDDDTKSSEAETGIINQKVRKSKT